MKRFLLFAIAGLLAAGCQDAPAPLEVETTPGLAPSAAPGERYIVVFRPETRDAPGLARQLVSQAGGRLDFTYEHAISGFAAALPEPALAGIRANPNVAYVEADQAVHAYVQTVPTGVQRIFADENVNLDNDGVDDVRVDVDVAIIDTGIDLDHPDLNVFASVDCTNESSGGPPWARTASCGAGGDDDNGHGSHVAGSVGAIDDGVGVVGVAPGARLHAVKVLDANGSGSIAMVVAGIDHVTADAATIEVANMSLGCECSSQAMDDAIANSVAAGVTYAVAAGNSDADAATHSPANHPDVITVSALADFDGEQGGLGSPTCRTDEDDTLANFSNWGSEIEITAPGVCILSTWKDGGYNTISGTSMASPHVAGAAALLASKGGAPSTIRQALINAGNFDWNDDSGDGTKEPLLDVSDGAVFAPATVAGGGGGSGDEPPAVDITSPLDGATVSSVVMITADASDNDAVTEVEFFVDGGSIGIDTDGGNGWSIDWDTTGEGEGSHDVTATATDTEGQTGSDTVTVTVDNVEDPAGVSVTGIDPNATSSGSSVDVTISGSGFAGGASVSFENGSGPAPEATVNNVSGDGTTIGATVTVKTGGPPRSRTWDVRVTNLDASTGVLSGGFTVNP